MSWAILQKQPFNKSSNTEMQIAEEESQADIAEYQRAREKLVAQLVARGINNQKVLQAIAAVPRHLFLEPALRHRAYQDTALPIGQSQTISQPFVVATMSQAAFAASQVDNVLEVGTGCGYQTAVLAQLAKRVCTVERIGSLQASAEERLRSLGFRNIEYRHGDGFVGWKDRAPFDAIVVTAGAEEVPKMLLAQLKRGGRLIIPIGPDGDQRLLAIGKTGNTWQEEELLPVRFVPLLRGLSE